MTTEDYCSYEIAKLLKEKGFDGVCDYAYSNKGNWFEIDRSNFDEVYCLRPTLQMAMRWLRDMHKLYIEIWPTYDMDTEEHTGWEITVSDLSDFGGAYLGDAGSYKTYEEAVEVALKTSLENFV